MEVKDKEAMNEENIESTSTDSPVAESLPSGETGGEEKGITAELELIQKELLYLRAEFDNYKKRMLRDQEQAIRFANEKLIKDLIGVIDHLERGVSHGKDLQTKGQTSEKDFSNFVNGVEMTQRELSQLLARFGVEFIGNPGEPFDPAKHEAISQQECPPEKDNTVLHVLQKGCLLHGRLLAPAKVVVAKSSKEI
jgi:molecular chaperone GrpE